MYVCVSVCIFKEQDHTLHCCSVTKSCPVFVTPWAAAHQASLSFTISQSFLKLVSNELMMLSNHLILSSPSPPALLPSQHQSLFQ